MSFGLEGADTPNNDGQGPVPTWLKVAIALAFIAGVLLAGYVFLSGAGRPENDLASVSSTSQPPLSDPPVDASISDRSPSRPPLTNIGR